MDTSRWVVTGRTGRPGPVEGIGPSVPVGSPSPIVAPTPPGEESRTGQARGLEGWSCSSFDTRLRSAKSDGPSALEGVRPRGRESVPGEWMVGGRTVVDGRGHAADTPACFA